MDGADILFMLDGSESVPDQAFKDLKKFVLKQTKLYNISSENNRIGMIVIGDKTQFTGLLDNVEDIEYRVARLEKGGGKRRVEDTMDEIRNYWLSYFRKDKDRTVVLFLHGRNARDGIAKLPNAAKSLQGKNRNIFVYKFVYGAVSQYSIACLVFLIITFKKNVYHF